MRICEIFGRNGHSDYKKVDVKFPLLKKRFKTGAVFHLKIFNEFP